MLSALDRLTRIPDEDVAALKKLRGGDFPKPRQLKPGRVAIAVVDMSEAFVRDEYPTGWAATADPCLAEIANLLEHARAQAIPVIYTTSEPLSNSAQVGEWTRGVPRGMAPFNLESPVAHAIAGEIAPTPEDILLVKAKPSAFFGTQLESILHALDIQTLVVTGMTTSGCVRATVVDGFMLNYHTIVPLSCVADRSQLSHEVNLFDMGAKYADIVTTDSLISAIDAI